MKNYHICYRFLFLFFSFSWIFFPVRSSTCISGMRLIQVIGIKQKNNSGSPLMIYTETIFG